MLALKILLFDWVDQISLTIIHAEIKNQYQY